MNLQKLDKLKKYFRIPIVLIILSVMALSYYIFDIINFVNQPASLDEALKIIVVEKGQPFKEAARTLKKTGIIKNHRKLRVYALLKGYDKKIQPGEYALSPSMPPVLILDKMLKGKGYLRRITVPEGYNLQQIATIVSNAGFGTKEEFIKIATDALFVHEKEIEASTFEGYLYPDTYFFTKGESIKSIISTMVDKFWSVYSLRWKVRAKMIGFTTHEIVTLASIIEKETAAPYERPLISAVFHNRLELGMKLETDPTVIYGMKNFTGNITRKDLLEATPYNTYIINRLPPGPIANPGYESIEAALYPAKTPYIYFVSKKDGTHFFSTNFKEHNDAVKKYQLGK